VPKKIQRYIIKSLKLNTKGNKKLCGNWVWWCMPVIPAPGRLRHEELESEVSLGYVVSLNPA
jgi:hypothetical protein